MLKKIMFLIAAILLDEAGDALAMTYTFSPNTLIQSSQMNANFQDIVDVINALTATNLSADCVTAAKLNIDVVRSGYGLIQHTDGSLYVDVSDTNPGLEISDGGIRVKAYGLIQRTANGTEWGRSGDFLLTASGTVPDGFTDVSATYNNHFIRISSGTALNTGGSDTHTHDAGSYAGPSHTHTGPSHTHSISAEQGTDDFYYSTSESTQISATTSPSGTGNTGAAGTGAVTGTSASANNVPVFVQMKMYQKT